MSPLLRTAIILGVLSAVGPFAIDMYLPAMPAIGEDLDASIAATQATITGYFLAFGLSQLVYGPAADRFGRKPPLYVGLVIFGIGTVACALAPSISALIAARFVQGLGGAAVMVIPRAIIRDYYTGADATRVMAKIMLVISVSPMLAPLAGAGLIALSGWRLVFWVLAAVAVGCILVTAIFQPETLPPERRQQVRPRELLRSSRVLLGDPVFMGLTFIGGLGMASFFVFIASAPFVYTETYGLTPTGFSLAFAVNAAGFFAASQLAGPLGDRFGMNRMVLWGTAGFAAFTLALLVITLSAPIPLWALIAMLFFANACLGVVIPSVMVMALDPHGERAGLASSLGGTLQMVAGGIAVTISSPFFSGAPAPMVTAIAICAALALAIALPLLRMAPTPA